MDMKKLILESTQYSGNSDKEIKALSASQLNDDVLRLWLRYKYGVVENDEISMATIGTLVHKGIECIIKERAATEDNFNIQSEVDLKMNFENTEWMLTGTADIVDFEERIVYDIKTIKKYRVSKLKNEMMSDDYTIQLNAYRMMLENTIGDRFKMAVLALSPDGGFSARTGNTEQTFEEIEIERIENSVISGMFIDKVKLLEYYIEANEVPQKCEDVWIRKVKGKAIPLRCQQYCSYNSICPYYNPKIETHTIDW